jgi:hypothetical protein
MIEGMNLSGVHGTVTMKAIYKVVYANKNRKNKIVIETIHFLMP